MRGIIKYTLAIYLALFLLTVPSVAVSSRLPSTTVKELKIQKLTNFISNKYKVNIFFIRDVVKHSYQIGHKTQFPTATDILAIIAIESSFDKYAKSKAKAKGLMQILYKDTSFDIRTNIADGVNLLNDYKGRLPIEGTIQAYNVGIGNYKSGMRNKNYLHKFKLAKQQLESI